MQLLVSHWSLAVHGLPIPFLSVLVNSGIRVAIGVDVGGTLVIVDDCTVGKGGRGVAIGVGVGVGSGVDVGVGTGDKSPAQQRKPIPFVRCPGELCRFRKKHPFVGDLSFPPTDPPRRKVLPSDSI